MMVEAQKVQRVGGKALQGVQNKELSVSVAPLASFLSGHKAVS